MISIIIPTLNAAAGLKRALPPLVRGVEAGIVRELIIADAGSTDTSRAIADAAGAKIVESAMGEGAQSIAGALGARGTWLMFLHADAALAEDWPDEALGILSSDGAHAHVFRVGLKNAPLRESWANFLVSLSKKPPRTQGLLISRTLYDSIGGYTAAPGAHRELIERIGGGRISLLRTKVFLPR